MPVALAQMLVAAALTASPPCVVERDGRPMRVCFDPGERFELDAGPVAGNEPLAGRLSGVLRLRKNRRGHHDPGLEWNRDHAILEASLELPQLSTRQARVEATAYKGVYIRRYEEGALVIPGSTLVRIPFPFDIGVSFDAAQIDYDAARPDLLRLGVLRAAPVLDAARRIPGAYRFAFGPQLAYELDMEKGAQPRHRLVPFSGGLVDVRFESDDGLWVAQVNGHAGWQLEVEGTSRLAWGAFVDLQRILIAIDDRPLAPFVRFEGGNEEGPPRFTAQLGLRLAAQLP